jgi:hypothetical protein
VQPADRRDAFLATTGSHARSPPRDQRILECKDPDAESGDGFSSRARLTTTHVIIRRPEKIGSPGFEASMKVRELADGEMRINRRTLKERELRGAAHVVIDRPENPQERVQPMYPAAGALLGHHELPSGRLVVGTPSTDAPQADQGRDDLTGLLVR